jgi:hypothetical protein
MSNDDPFFFNTLGKLQGAVKNYFVDGNSKGYPDINTWDLSQLTSLSNVFNGVTITQDINWATTHNVTEINTMFQNTTISAQIVLNTINTKTMHHMFHKCTISAPIILNMNHVLNAGLMFHGSTITTELRLDTENVTNMNGMFASSQILAPITLNTSNVDIMSDMFFKAIISADIQLSSVANVSRMIKMYAGSRCTGSFVHLNDFQPTNLRDAKQMLTECEWFNEEINWNCPKLVNCEDMFRRCVNLNSQIQIRFEWPRNRYGGIEFKHMFKGCAHLTVVPFLLGLPNDASMSGIFTDTPLQRRFGYMTKAKNLNEYYEQSLFDTLDTRDKIAERKEIVSASTVGFTNNISNKVFNQKSLRNTIRSYLGGKRRRRRTRKRKTHSHRRRH